MIDDRLIESEGPVEANENFNRVLALVDNVEKKAFGVSAEAAMLASVADTNFDVVHLLADITLTDKVAIANTNLVIKGNEYSLKDATLDATQYMAVQIAAENVTIKNTVFEISGNSDGNALYSIDVYAANATIEDNTFIMANAGSSGAVSVYYEGYAGQKLNNNTFSNGVALTGGVVMDEIKNNTFAATKGFGLGECTINGIHYFESDPEKVAAIKAYLIEQGNSTTDEETGLVVEGYFEA